MAVGFLQAPAQFKQLFEAKGNSTLTVKYGYCWIQGGQKGRKDGAILVIALTVLLCETD